MSSICSQPDSNKEAARLPIGPVLDELCQTVPSLPPGKLCRCDSEVICEVGIAAFL
eukprot:CAMPEP_0169149080 /NCGR_PEP_ID=MMETSP1015-20121227/49291_1 /TAXON_ID=342587 /ORGANISM="Karlodinium micrum, Strain CCMP2283" /LENGTH=55 /DNA_ID=CAMNT_0009217787 /DNA_START=78 /DNA_END=245 /DNA_ORIENTATION=+